jgi:hypothetical protein
MGVENDLFLIMTLENFLGINGNHTNHRRDKEEPSEITKPLRELTDGEILLVQINVIYLQTISDEQVLKKEAVVKLDEERLGNHVSRLGIHKLGDEEETSIRISFSEGEESISLENGDEIIDFKAQENGRYWERVMYEEDNGITTESRIVMTKARLGALSSLMGVCKEEIDSINGGGSL